MIQLWVTLSEDLVERIMAVAGDMIQVKKGVTYINSPAPPTHQTTFRQ